jgi:hypothetical protein
MALPGQHAPTANAQTGLAVTSVALTTTGAILAATGVGALPGAIIAGVGAFVGLAAGVLNPEKTAIVQSLTSQGYSKDFAQGYYKYASVSDAQLHDAATKLREKVQKDGSNEAALDELRAIAAIWGERQQALAAQTLAIAPPQPVPVVPPWAGIAALAMLGAGILIVNRKQGRR